MDLSPKEFSKLTNDDSSLKSYCLSVTSGKNFKTRCPVCTRKITKNQQPKSLPCIDCHSLVHRKCTNIPLSDLLNTKPKHIKNFSCNTCLSQHFPYQDLTNYDVQKLSFNSLYFCPCLDKSTETETKNCEEFKNTTNLYDCDSIFTHAPDPHNHMDNTLDLNLQCNYYTNHEFHKLAKEIDDSRKKPLSLLHSNIESLMHNFDQLDNLCSDLNYPFDIIAVTETWNPAKNKDRFIPKMLENYQKYNGLPGTSLKSGCGLYIRTDLKYKDRKDLDIQHCDDLNEYQCKFIEVINTKGSNILICVSYRHPKKASNNSYNTWLEDTLVKISREHKILIFLGDFNYNLLKYSQDNNVRTFVDTMASHNMQPTINKPTRIIKNQKPSLIDNFFTNAIDRNIITGNLVSKITDHMPNFMIMKDVYFNTNRKFNKRRSFRNFDLAKYQEDISSIDLTPIILRSSDINEIYKYYHDQLLTVINHHAPFITLTKKELNWTKKPWIGKRLQKIIAEKDSVYTKYLKNRSKFWYKRYRTLCDIVKKGIAGAKKSYFAWYFKTNMNNSKKIWKGINEIIHNKFSKDITDIFLDDNGSIITDQKVVANKFNKFYTSIAEKLVTKLGKPSNKFQDYLKNPNEHTIFLNETDHGEVATLLYKLDVTKSGDIYGITPRLLKDAGPSMASNLSILFNISLKEGIFPQLLKVSKVIPIYKAESKLLASNYRPISLLPIIGKLFEKIIFSRLTSFIKKYNLLYSRQYGFQNGKSTEHAVIDIQENILNSLENKKIPCCLLLDFAKAFDTVNHSILVQKLNHYGIRGPALQLIESYLTDRQQCVQINNSTSDLDFIRHGVPQGSILGPLFFLLYINDIANSSTVLKFYLFADDTTIFLSHKDPRQLEEILNRELVHVSNWLIANKLSLNVGKSNLLLFRGKNSKLPALNIKINGLAVEEKEYAKYLGILIDNKLSFSQHINHVKAKLIKGNAILSKVRHYLPKTTLLSTYHAYIQPHIDYGLNVWGHTYKTHILPIQRQQRKAIRLMNFAKKPDYSTTRQDNQTTELFIKDKILPFTENLKLSTAKLFWKASNDNLPTTLAPLFNKRSNNTYHLPFRRIDATQNSPIYQGVQAWNSIPAEIRSKSTLNAFKNNYKKLLFEKINA